MPLDRRLSNGLSSRLLSLVTGVRLFDVQCGYRMIRADLLRKMDFKANDYMIESEMLLLGARLKARFGFVPIAAVYNGEKSHIRSFKIVFRFFKTLWRTRHLWLKSAQGRGEPA